MIEHDSYTAYFSNLATQHKILLHSEGNPVFFRVNMEEVLAGLQEIKSDKAIILEAFSGNVTGPDDSTLYDVVQGAFTIVQNVKNEDYDAEEDALQLTKSIGFDVISRMRRDARAGHALMKFLDTLSFSYGKVGPVADNHFGWRFEFTLRKGAGVAYVPAKWADEEEV